MYRRLAVSVGAASLIMLSGLLGAMPLASAQSTVIVTIPPGSGLPAGAPGYAPDTVTVMIGVNNTVEWMNNDTVSGKGTAHTVTVNSQPTGGNWPVAGSGNMPVNTTYSFTFTVPGTYTYYCTYHSWMTGTVVVLASTSTTTHTTPEFPGISMALLLFAVIAVVVVVASRLRPTRTTMPTTGAADSRTLPPA